MSTIQELLRQYESNLDAGIQAAEAGNKARAKDLLLLAADRLFDIAERTTIYELHDARIRQANALLDDVEAIVAAKDRKRSPVSDAGSDNKSQRWELLEKPGISFADIAGLDEVKDVVRRRVIYPMQNPEKAKRWKKRAGGGVLLYGPPGNGKTMIAKAVATELNAPFFDVKCSDIMTKWVGEAEQNVRDLFDTARGYDLAVIFFDESEALIGSRGKGSTVMDRVIPEFLAQVDGVSSNVGNILLLGATNRPWDMDEAALRPGRFGDELIYVGLPDAPARKYLLTHRFDGLSVSDEVRIDELVQRTEGYSGADLAALTNRATDEPYSRELESDQLHQVTQDDMECALTLIQPSVSVKHLQRYQKWRETRE